MSNSNIFVGGGGYKRFVIRVISPAAKQIVTELFTTLVVIRYTTYMNLKTKRIQLFFLPSPRNISYVQRLVCMIPYCKISSILPTVYIMKQYQNVKALNGT